MAPEEHTEKIFKTILGGCNSVINDIASLRNKHGDAHGNGRDYYKPQKGMLY
jgi:Abortive infection C-terminus